MRLFFFLVLISCNWQLNAQSTFSGNVYFLNSKKQPATGVHVVSKGSNNDYSKSDGSYKLYFSDKKPGDRVVINTSKTDGEGKKIILANKKIVRQFRIPSQQSESFEIIVADSLTYVRNTKVYIQSLLKLKTSELRKLRQQLDKQNQKNVQTNAEKQKLVNKIIALEKDLGRPTEDLEKKANYLALFNLENAPDFTQKIMSKLRDAQKIDDVLQLIDQDRLYMLNKKYREKLRTQKDSIPFYQKKIDFLYNAYDLRKELLLSVNRFDEAIQCIEAQIKLDEFKLRDSLQLAVSYDDVADLLLKIGRYKEAKGYAKKLERFSRHNENLRGFSFAARKNIQEVDYLLSQKRDQFFYINLLDSTFIMEFESILDTTYFGADHVDRDLRADTLGVLLFKDIISYYKEINTSENSQEESCNFFTNLLSNPLLEEMARDSYYIYLKYAVCEEMTYPEIAARLNQYVENISDDDAKKLRTISDSYVFLGGIYGELEEDSLMMDAREKAIIAREKYSNEEDVDDLTKLYLDYGNDLSYTFFIDSNFYVQKGITFYEKALELQKSQLSPFHFDIADTYHDYASFHYQLDNYTRAESLLFNTIDIKLTHLEEDAYELYYDYSFMADIYESMNDTVQYLNYQEKTIALNIKYRPLYDPSLLTLYWGQLNYYQNSSKYTKTLSVISKLEKALQYHKDSTSIYEEDRLDGYLVDCLRNKAIIYARSGNLKQAKTLWSSYKKGEKSNNYNDKYMELHLALLEKNESDILLLITNHYFYIDYILPESTLLINQLDENGLIRRILKKRIQNGY